ncbi:hypothetical protein RDWZM_008123 [Blomia tropicalis]|uniref:Uncharacterized protein n=1 Tax=Blomia tropicalis TaxID=40697 RepID=A0A9Q0RJS1_BLOTA|nr:hypothetical protein RDWZM_008123 [Blomia tropicalis]
MDDVYGLSVNPFNNNVFVSASNEVMLWDIRMPHVKSTQLAVGSGQFHSVMYNPLNENIVVTANSRDGIDLYDVRRPMKKLFHFYSSSILNSQNVMCVQFNKTGNLIFALKRRSAPILYDIRSPYPLAEFDNSDYYNSCTLKSCCFLGENEQFVASGSDNFKIYIWKIPDFILNGSNNKNPLKEDSIIRVKNAHHILSGHRSIVNQVRFNSKNGFIASTGVEKMIKIWSPIMQFNEEHQVESQQSNHITSNNNPYTSRPVMRRSVYTYRDYLNLIQADRYYVPNEYGSTNTSEDARMIAYFDSMIERDISSSMRSSSDEQSPSYFDRIAFTGMKGYICKDNDFCESPLKEEIAFNEISTDSDNKFSIQKRFDFTQKYDSKNLKKHDYLSYVFAKRFYVRYLNSFLNNLKSQIMENDIDSIIDENVSDALETNNGTQNEPHSMETVFLQNERIVTNEIDSCLLNQKIIAKKRNLLTFFALKFSKSIILSLKFGAFFDKSKCKFLKEHIDDDDLMEDSKKQISIQIKNMSKIEGRNLCDKRLYNLLNNLYKSANDLLIFLRETDMKIEKHCDSSEDGSIDTPNYRHTNRHTDSDISSSTSSSSLSTSSSSSSDEDSEDEVKLDEPNDDCNPDEIDIEVKQSNFIGDVKADVMPDADIPSTSTKTSTSTGEGTSGSQSYSSVVQPQTPIFFKKIDRSNKRYKQRVVNKPKKNSPNKRKRLS